MMTERSRYQKKQRCIYKILATRLTPEQQAAVMYWPFIAKIPIIPCNSKIKQVTFKDWQILNLDKVDYKNNLESGLYDNGIAVRLGQTLPHCRQQG